MYTVNDYQAALFPYAYNVLGSVEDAKDAVQEVYARYVSTPRERVADEKNYLIKSVVNQAINMRAKRKTVPADSVWLPEPVATERADTNLNMRDIVSYSMLLLLEQLNPKERAVFILKEAFAYTHEEIAEVLSSTVENSRKLLSRAREKINPSAKITPPAKPQPQRNSLLENYIGAIRSGDTATLEQLLSRDITFYADSGGKTQLVRKICHGVAEVGPLMVYIYSKFQQNMTAVPATFNHQPALLYYANNRLLVCQVFTLSEDGSHITEICSLLDPDKIKSMLDL